MGPPPADMGGDGPMGPPDMGGPTSRRYGWDPAMGPADMGGDPAMGPPIWVVTQQWDQTTA